MPTYLFEVSYSVEGAAGLLEQGGTARLTAITTAVEDLGGSVEAFYFALGHDDAYLIASLPNVEAVAAMSITVAAAGGARVSTHELLSPADVDEALQNQVHYKPPIG
jgi:uncharacterized protein with GYD domain